MSSSDKTSIPAVLVGVTRRTALESAVGAFKGTPYYCAAVLDMSEAPEPYQFDARNLGLVLYALHPRPRILITGTALDKETVAEIEPVWREHAARVAEKCHWVALSRNHGRPGPPPPGIELVMMKELDAIFRPEVKHE